MPTPSGPDEHGVSVWVINGYVLHVRHRDGCPAAVAELVNDIPDGVLNQERLSVMVHDQGVIAIPAVDGGGVRSGTDIVSDRVIPRAGINDDSVISRTRSYADRVIAGATFLVDVVVTITALNN